MASCGEEPYLTHFKNKEQFTEQYKDDQILNSTFNSFYNATCSFVIRHLMVIESQSHDTHININAVKQENTYIIYK